VWSSGSLAGAGIDRVLLLLAARNASGTLSVQADDVLAVRFRNGEIVGADALKESLTHGLGRILVAAGHLNRDQVATIESSELGGSVVDHLLATGMVPPDTLAGCVRQHTYLLLLRLLGWKSGDYQFYEGEVSTNLDLRPLSVEELLVRASEEDPRLLGATVAPLGEEVLRPLLGRRAVRVFNWHQQPDQETDSGTDDEWLTPFEDGLLRSLDGLTPAREFKDALGVDEFRLRFALHRLRRMGLVESVGDAVAAPVAPAPPNAPAAAAAAASEVTVRPAVKAPPRRSTARAESQAAAAKPSAWTELGGQLGDLSRAFSYILSAGLAVLVLGLVLWGGSAPRLHQPFPWQETKRERLENLRLQAQEHDLIGKLKTYRILYGTFPLDLRPLVDSGLVRPGDIEDSHGRAVVFEALDHGFVLGLEDEGGENRVRPRTHFSVTGDFLLDPDFTRLEGQPGGTPVQVLD
jgi:hypothetical protein